MAMTPSGLSDAIKSAIEAEQGGPPPNAFGITALQKFCDAMGNAIVNYIQGNADVLPATHQSLPLSTLGVQSTGADPQGGVVISNQVNEPVVVGTGSIA